MFAGLGRQFLGGASGDRSKSSLLLSAHKVNPAEESSPAAPAGARTLNLSITSPAFYQQAIPDPRLGVRSTPRVTVVARKRPQSFCRKCRWQVIPKHAYALKPKKSEWADYAVAQS